MKKFVYLMALLLPLTAAAQTQSGVRASMAADWKIRKGLHLTVEEELRMDGVFSSLNRLQTTIGLEYKVSPYVKLGAGYILINPYSAGNLYFKGAAPPFLCGRHGTLQFERLQFLLEGAGAAYASHRRFQRISEHAQPGGPENPSGRVLQGLDVLRARGVL